MESEIVILAIAVPNRALVVGQLWKNRTKSTSIMRHSLKGVQLDLFFFINLSIMFRGQACKKLSMFIRPWTSIFPSLFRLYLVILLGAIYTSTLLHGKSLSHKS